MRAPVRYILDVLFPKSCAGCGTMGILLCEACRKGISPAGRSSSVLAACRYDGVVKKIFAAVKLRNEHRHLPGLTELLVDNLEKDKRFSRYAKSATVTYIPMHWMKRNIRGFNQSEMIARQVAEHFSSAVISLLRRVRYGSRQSALSKALRLRNTQGLFAYRPTDGLDIRGRKILLIDDIRTTGATLDEASRVLLAAGAAEVRCAVIAQD